MMKTKLHYANYDQIIEAVQAIESDTILLVIDHYFWSLYQNEFPIDKAIKNKKVIPWKAPNGEQVKNFQDFESCLEFFLEKGVHRNAHMVAIGGGAVSDFAGYVAASLLRGISWSVVPTTLLSMVDASIGGKVAINSRYGKNLVGAFHNPENVWINEKFLEKLAENELLSGKGEILKYAFLDNQIFKLINDENLDLKEVIKACAEFKLSLTEKDFKESGHRKILNLGHTIGHAIEKIYSLPHGVAVMWGIVLIFDVFMNGAYIHDLKRLKQNLGWVEEDAPWKNRNFPIDKIMTYLSKDKKVVSQGEVELILLDGIGKPQVERLALSEIEKKLKEAKDGLKSLVL